ncbi:hypothetical protein WME94_05060 [Sorangium sp. So ce429]
MSRSATYLGRVRGRRYWRTHITVNLVVFFPGLKTSPSWMVAQKSMVRGPD